MEPPPRAAEKPGGDRIGAVSLALTSLPVVVAVFGILKMAHWDLTLVPVVLKASDLGAVAINYLFSSLHLVAMVGMGMVVFTARREILRPWAAFGTIVAITVSSVFLVPAVYLFLIALASLVAVTSLRPPTHEMSGFQKAGFGFVVLLYVVAFVNHLVHGRPWLPAEIIEKTDQARLVAYVVESGDHDLTAIPANGDDPVIIRQDEIKSRTLCRDRRPGLIGDAARLTLSALVAQREPDKAMPRCT